MTEEFIPMVVTKDRTGTIAWAKEPPFLIGPAQYWNGGRAMQLDNNAFPSMATPSRRRARLVLEGE